MLSAVLVALALARAGANAHFVEQQPLMDVVNIDVSKEEWTSKYGPQVDMGYTGPLSFSHLPYTRCLDDGTALFDIGIIGFPFDTTTSYRPGARFGPFAIRAGSRRQGTGRGTLAWGGMSPEEAGASLLDCGDVPLSALNNLKAIDQMEAAYSTLLQRPVYGGTSAAYKSRTAALALDGKEHPRLVTLGGDHTIVLPILRSLYKVYGPVSVIHFDAHLDTWPNTGDPSHGSFFAIAAEEGLMTNTSIHGGIRCHMSKADLQHDGDVGFQLITTEDIDDYGIVNVIKKIRERVADSAVYLSLDIHVVDPGFAPATGTVEPGGWTTREVKRILRGLSGLNFV